MISGSVDKGIIDTLIWGNMDSEYIEAKFPLNISGEICEMVKDLVWELFIGFIYFTHYKCGLMPKFNRYEKVEFDSEVGDFADRSSWIRFMICVEPIRGPYSFKQFTGKNDDEHTICILLDTFSLIECGKILNETDLKGESKFSFPEISDEFDVKSSGLSDMLLYFKNLNDTKLDHAHILILRPSKLAKYLYSLDDTLESLQDYPEKIARKEGWEKMTMVDKAGYFGMSSRRLRGCNEENFRELLKEHSIEIPNVTFLTFYEYIQDKLDLHIKKEWIDIRDRYIAYHKELLKHTIPGLGEKNFRFAKAYLAKAKEYLEAGNYTESVTHSCKAMEKILFVLAGSRQNLSNNIRSVVKKHNDLKKHETTLDFVRTTRNMLLHADGMNECDENAARFALEGMDQFLMDVEGYLL